MNLQMHRSFALFQKITAAVRGVWFWPWSAPLALLVLTILAYGLRALSLGFFWDDWPYLWLFHSLGPEGIAAALEQDRPFLSFIYITTLSFLGSSTLAWQVFALLARWLCGVGLWWALAQTWPGSSHKVFWAAALFVVYPGFTQQWIAIIYGQAFVLFAATLFSLGITLWLADSRPSGRLIRWAGTLAALALSAFTMFSTEYFFGIELLRPVLLGVIFARQFPLSGRLSPSTMARRALQVLRWWAPYLALMIAFVIWRGFIHTFPGKHLNVVTGLGASPWNTLTGLALTVAEDFVEATLLAWGQTIHQDWLTGWAAARNLRIPALLIGVGVLAWVYLARLRPAAQLVPSTNSPAQPDNWAAPAIGVGILAFLAAGWPFWVTTLPMRMGFPQDRYSLPLAVGVCLLLAGLIDALGRNRLAKTAVVALAIALAVGFHVEMAAAYRSDWSQMRDLFWQLTWRAPSIRPHTLLLTDSLGLRFYEDDSLTAPLNWTYDPNNHGEEMNYLWFDLYVRQNTLTDLVPGIPIRRAFRGKEFNGSTSQVLVLAYNPPGCLKILDPRYDLALPRLPERVGRALPLSSPQQWIAAANPPAFPPAEIFGPEPRHRWCYYYQKASLARQVGDWEEVTRLAGESIRRGIRPERPQDQDEFLPFIEGYARVNRWDDAAQLTVDTYYWSPDLQPALCEVWRRSVAGNPPDETLERVLSAVNGKLQCGIVP
mgnify:CR=1 FL=1